jgi:hypothetical protein
MFDFGELLFLVVCTRKKEKNLRFRPAKAKKRGPISGPR